MTRSRLLFWTRSVRRCRGGVLLLTLAASWMGGAARAATLNWTNGSGGSADVPTNWTPNAIPASTDLLLFTLGNSYPVTFTSNTTQSHEMRFRAGSVQLLFTSLHTVGTAIQFSDLAHDTSTATITGGTLRSNGQVLIGVVATSKGTLNLQTAGALLEIPGTVNDLNVGVVGLGTLHAQVGGRVQVGDDLLVGAQSGGVGHVLVDGHQTSPIVVGSSLYTLGGATSDARIGDLGYGDMIVSNFGIAHVDGSVYVAPTDRPLFDGNGFLTVGGAGGLAAMSVGQNLWIGAGGGGAGGIGTVNVLDNGNLAVTGTTTLGTNGNANAILQIASGVTGGVFSTGSFVWDDDATLTFTGGTLTVDGGTFDPGTISRTISGTVPNATTGPVFILENGATATLPATPISLHLGTTGFGAARALTGAAWTLNGDLQLGEVAGGTGVLTLTGGSLSASFVKVGLAGSGQLGVTQNGALTGSSLSIAANTTGTGTVNVSDTGSHITVNSVTIGRNVASPAPVNTLDIANHGLVTANGTVTGGTVNANGGLIVHSTGKFTTPGDIFDMGVVDLEGGEVDADTVSLGVSGRLDGAGAVVADVVNGGQVRPGASTGTAKRIAISGLYAQTAGGFYRAGLGNHATSEWDTVTVTGAATLSGTLDITRLGTFTPHVGDVYRIMTFASRTGTFSTVTLEGGPLLGFSVTYNATSVDVVVTGATGVDGPLASALPGSIELLGRRTAGGSEIELALPRASSVRLSVYDVAGREVAVLRDGIVPAGHNRYDFGRGASAVPSGIYFARARVTSPDGSTVRTARVPVVR